MGHIFNPYRQLTEEEREKILKMCQSTHTKFINHVKKYRGNKLKVDDKMFTGEVYTGEQGKENGLVDDVGSMIDVLERKYPGCKVETPEQKSFLQGFFANV